MLEVKSVLVTSSCGVLQEEIPLFRPVMITDILMPENRLPDGSACTMFTKPETDHGHLVLEDGLLSTTLTNQVADLAADIGIDVHIGGVFAYAQGPRTKSKAGGCHSPWRFPCHEQQHDESPLLPFRE